MEKVSTKKQGKIYYGWFVVAISFIIMSIAYGVYFSWPVFYVAILNDFGWSRAETAVIFSVGSIVYGFASPVSGFLFDRFGPRRLFITSALVLFIGAVGASRSDAVYQLSLFFGIFVAAGTICAGFVPHSVMISNWFIKRRGTALGIAQAGTRDAFLLAPLIQLVILALGWRNAYMVLAVAVVTIIIPLTLFLRARPQDMGLLPDGESEDSYGPEHSKRPTTKKLIVKDEAWAGTQWTLSKAVRRRQFWSLFFIMFGTGFCFTSLINHLVALIGDIGFSPMFAASLLTVYAVAAMLGRSFGFVSDYLGREVTFSLCMVVTILPLPILLVVRDTSAPWLLYVFIASFGFGNGSCMPAYTATASDLFQGKHFGTIIGSANLGYGLAASAGTWLYGYVFDATGTYTIAIIITMFSALLMMAAIWVAAPRKVKQVVRLSVTRG